MAVDKLINQTQGDEIIEALSDISEKLEDVITMTPAKLGFGYTVCDTAADTAAKTANLANYQLTEGSIVYVKFTYGNTATNPTLNLNNTGAKPMYYRGAAVESDAIIAGDIGTFVYSTNVYNLVSTDADGSEGVLSVGAEGGIITDQAGGAAISSTGSVKLNLKSDTAYTGTVSDPATTDKVYPVALDSTGHPCVGVPWTDTTYTQVSNSAITVNNTNHTIGVATGTTSTAGVVQLTDSYSSTSTTTAATPNAVKATYDLADGKYAKPQTGIPAADLATAVQTSLTAADNAVPKTRTVNSKALSSDITLTAADVGAIATTAKGANGGVAELDSNGKVPSSQLPSYVDDVLEYSSKSSFPSTGETGKIYVDTSDNKTYRWGGSTYVEISASLALGDTSSTAYYGDRGKAAYDHSQTTSGNPHNVTKGDVGLGNVGNFKAVSTVASQGLSDTEKSNARANIGAGTGNGTYSKPSGGIPKSDLATAVQTALDQVNTNKTNILYSLQTGVKNWIPVDHANMTEGAFLFRDYELALPAGDYVFYINITSVTTATGMNFIASNGLDVGTNRTADVTIQPLYTGVSTVNVTVAAGTTHVSLYINGAVVMPEIMLCPKQIWDTTNHDFQPFALSNADLTQGLAELNAHPFLTVPVNHNMIYRGKNLGDTFTDAQHTALSGGNFTDLYLGDYWTKSVTIPAFYEVTTSEPSDWSTNYTSYYTKSGDTYTPVSGDTAPTWVANTYYERQVPEQTVTLKAVIADFDTFYAGYASGYAGINTHHAAVIVHGSNNVVWNKTNTTAGGYVNSLIHKWLVNSALPQIETWFGSAKVLSHQKLLTNAITGDAASGWAWSSQKISLLSENQMYGSKVWGNSKATNGGYEPGEAFKHLNVFNHIDANLLFGNKNIWLRDIASAVWSAGLDIIGYAGSHGASNTSVAPAALILLS